MDVAYRMDIPKEYIASAALVSASSIIGRRAAVRPKVNDPSEEHANLRGLIVAPPGELKPHEGLIVPSGPLKASSVADVRSATKNTPLPSWDQFTSPLPTEKV